MTKHASGCQNYGPFLGPYSNTAPIIYGTQKGTLILTTTHTVFLYYRRWLLALAPRGQPCIPPTMLHRS